MIGIGNLREVFLDDSNRALRRVFQIEPASLNQSKILSYASMIEMALEDGSISGATGAELADEVAHLLCDAFDLISSPNPTKYEAAALAATLFLASGFEAKASTVFRSGPTYEFILGSSRDALPLVLYGAGTAYLALLRKHLKDLKNIAQDLKGLVSAGLAGHEGRYAFVLSSILFETASFCGALSEDRPDAKAIRAKVHLLISIAQVIGSPSLLETSERIKTTVEEICKNSLLAILMVAKVKLKAETLSPFIRGQNAVLTLWPGQKQSIANGVLNPDRSFVLALPTSGGKTLLAELRIAQFLAKNPDQLVIFVVPYNALGSQIKRQLDERFASTPVGAATLWTGAFEIDLTYEPPEHLLVTTPEKLDSIYRRAMLGEDDCAELICRFGMLVIDEVHMVGVPGRGLALEMLLSRIRNHFPNLPILALSAVAGNPEDLSEWLSGKRDNSTTSSWSPTRREVLVLHRNGLLRNSSGDAILDFGKVKDIGKKAAALAVQFVKANAGPVLVFCTQRGYCESIVKSYVSTFRQDVESDKRLLRSRQLAERLESESPGEFLGLVEGLRCGVAFHHAGLTVQVREEIENLARDNELDVICATTTLAEGVHLPFRSVIVPYLSYIGDEYIEAGLLRNVIGRAGRAFSNVRSTAVIFAPITRPGMTHLNNVLLPGLENPEPIKSQLRFVGAQSTSPKMLANHLRFEDQLLALVIEPLVGGNSRDAYSSTLCKVQAPHSANANRFAELFYAEMENPENGFLIRNSPLVLTEFGKVAALSGLSARSMLLIRSYLEALFESKNIWFDVDSWLDVQLPEAIVTVIADLSVLAFEYVENCARKKYGHEQRVMSQVATNGVLALNEATKVDRAVLVQWLRGETISASWKQLKALNLDWPASAKKSEAEGESWLLETINQRQQMHRWILSAGIRFSKYICKKNGVVAPAFTEALSCLRFGVPSSRAALLVSYGIERSLSAKLNLWLGSFVGFGEQSFRDGVLRELRMRSVEDVFSNDEIRKLETVLT